MGPPQTAFENPTRFRIIYYIQVSKKKKLSLEFSNVFPPFPMLGFSLSLLTSPLNTLCSSWPECAPVPAAPSGPPPGGGVHTPVESYRPARPRNRGSRRFWSLLRRGGGSGNCWLTFVISERDINVLKVPTIEQELAQKKGFSSLLWSQGLAAVRPCVH